MSSQQLEHNNEFYELLRTYKEEIVDYKMKGIPFTPEEQIKSFDEILQAYKDYLSYDADSDSRTYISRGLMEKNKVAYQEIEWDYKGFKNIRMYPVNNMIDLKTLQLFESEDYQHTLYGHGANLGEYDVLTTRDFMANLLEIMTHVHFDAINEEHLSWVSSEFIFSVYMMAYSNYYSLRSQGLEAITFCKTYLPYIKKRCYGDTLKCRHPEIVSTREQMFIDDEVDKIKDKEWNTVIKTMRHLNRCPINTSTIKAAYFKITNEEYRCNKVVYNFVKDYYKTFALRVLKHAKHNRVSVLITVKLLRLYMEDTPNEFNEIAGLMTRYPQHYRSMI